jgi:hypothetical protein
MRSVLVATSDNRMDCRFAFSDPINLLPKKCVKCGFPDLDHIPQPYFVGKSRTMTPNELAGAENGNFFVRNRVRQVLELLDPGLCSFYPTTFSGTTTATPWLLAVPNQQIVTARVDPSIPRCAACGEPRSAHPGTQWSESLFGAPPRGQLSGEGWAAEGEYDVLKSSTWGSSERGWNLWISRDLYVSVRLLHLLKKIKAKGFYEATCQKPVSPNKEESAWINEKVQFLVSAGIALHAEGTLSETDSQWLREYIKTHSLDWKPNWDIKAVERRIKVKLPKSYLDFITVVGPTSFENIDQQEGFTASIVPPDQLQTQDGDGELEDEDSKPMDALTFATTDHGDCFCFEVQKGKKEFAILLYNHEGHFFEPYADNFAACIKRFATEH